MNIKSISYNPVKCSPIKPQSFNGLWGKFSQVSDIEPAMQIPLVNKYFYYYPFKDESEEQIAKVLKANSDAKIVNDDGEDKYIIKEAKRTIRAPFTEEEYRKYLALKPTDKLDLNMKNIHSTVKHRFITSGFEDKPQLPASNPNLSI